MDRDTSPAVLVAESDPDTRELFCRVLARGGLSPVVAGIEPAAHCRAALLAIRRADDPETEAAAVRAAAPHARVVFVIASHFAARPADLMRLPGAAGVLTKPFTPDQLLAAVRAALE